MQKSNLSRKKLLFLVPIFLLPIAVIAYVFFQFKSATNNAVANRDSQFNSSLPAPQLKKSDKNKLELYMEAKEDSLQREKVLRGNDVFDRGEYEEISADSLPTSSKSKLRAQERLVNNQLERIMEEIHYQDGSSKEKPSLAASGQSTSREVERLEKLLQSIKSSEPSGEDTELQRLDDMLDKIMQIQQPAIPESTGNDDSIPLVLPTSTSSTEMENQGFWGLEDDIVQPTIQKAAIRAVISEDQTVKEGSTIKMRLLDDIYINQVKIPASHLVYGVCAISNERMNVTINSIVYNGTIFPVKLKVYDMDGFSGIHVPGAITRDAAKQGLAQSIQSINPMLSAQIATAGIQSLKNLMSTKVRTVQATIKSGHEVLLQ